MYSCVFWCEFIDLVVFFSYYEESDRGHTITAKKKNRTKQYRNTSKFYFIEKSKNNDI